MLLYTNLEDRWELAREHPGRDRRGLPRRVAHGTTAEDAVAYLESVLIGWVDLKLADGDADVPVMGGTSLVPEQ